MTVRLRAVGIFSGLFFVLTVSGLSTSAMADDITPKDLKPNCLDPNRVKDIRDRFEWRVVTEANGKPAETFSACDPSRLSYKVFKALIDLEDFPKFEMKNDGFDQGILGTSITKYIRDRVRMFVFEASNSDECGKFTAAYVNPTDGPIVYLCPHLNTASSVEVMGMLVHEVRHLDEEGYPHVDCKQGYRTDMGEACDPSYAYKGSYGAGTELSVRISRTQALPLPLRQEARATALIDLMNNFNKLPLGLTKGIFLQNQDGPVLFFDPAGNGEVVIQNTSAHTLLTKRRIGLPTLFDPEAGSVKTYLFEKDLFDAGGDYADAYRESYSPEKRKALKDAYSEESADCLLFEDEVNCSIEKRKVSVKLKSMKPLGFVTVNKRLAISSADGLVYRLPKDLNQMQNKKESDLEKLPNPHAYVNFFEFQQGVFIGLNKDGVVLKSSSWKSSPKETKMFESYRFKKAVGPVTWSKQLEDL